MATAPAPQGGQSWVKWLVIAVAVIAVGSGAWYAFGYFAAKGTIDAVTDAKNGDVSRSTVDHSGQQGERDYTNVDPNTLSQPEFFSSYPEELRVKWATEYVDKHFEDALAGLNKHLAQYNRTLLPGNVPRHMSEDMNINDILNYHSVVNYMSANLPVNEKERVLSAIVDTESPNRQDIMNNNGPEASSGTWEVNINDNAGASKQMISPKFKSTPIQGYNPNGSPSYVAVVRDRHAQTVSEVILRYTNGQWTLHTVLSPQVDLDRWITYPESLQVS